MCINTLIHCLNGMLPFLCVYNFLPCFLYYIKHIIDLTTPDIIFSNS